MSDIKWSTSVRQRGKKTLPPLPNEIYLEILQFFRLTEAVVVTEGPRAKKDLLNLALVCRFFCSIVVPWLFETLRFIPRIGSEYKDFASQDYAPFCEDIVKGKMAARKLARYVKRCTLKMWDLDDDRLVPACSYREFLSLYWKALWHMPNIQEISLMDTSFTKEFLQTIGHLRHLKSLILGDCSLADDVNARHLRNLSSLELESLVVAFSAQDHVLMGFDVALTIFPVLKQLNLKFLLNLVTNSWYLIHGLSETEGILPLETLDLYMIDDPEMMAKLLQRTPSLTTLRVCCIRNRSTAKFILDSTALPVLKNVEGPISFLACLIPGRPISSLRVANSLESFAISQPELEALKSSSSPILHMQIPLSFYLQIPFHKHFLHIRTLRVDFCADDIPDTSQPHNVLIEQAILALTQAWPEHPPLRTLDLCFDRLGWPPLFFNPFKQEGWIYNLLLPKFPSLCKCLFGDTVHWSYLESSWIAELPSNFFRNLVNHCKAGRITYEELQNFIGSLVDGKSEVTNDDIEQSG
ncbi:hypothetical protein GALMADRAFT_223542 [Galerina marginata CBS 339.88]|uniref:Uncharacterized protein n=1 Tax=Galerina marginata (strain CBS 339.88) TaxID=685588 RepID=A0A067T7Y5_GALM3|nr:hypothetical protein GALMADRAFT_223542 [Galerina marginata CBS 339.88]